jgi:putative OPT family oligopeptide transporter
MSQAKELRPFVPAHESPREFTVRAVVLGIVLCVLFGMANAFLGLKIGLTVASSIPCAVISMAVLRGLLRRGTILENNIVQTVGSAGEALAAGLIFTVPALFFLGGEAGLAKDSRPLTLWEIFVLVSAGGVLGVLIMVPLRRQLMVKEHGTLPFPEGTACAEVLIAGEEGGARARQIFFGLIAGGLYRFAMKGTNLFRDTVSWTFDGFYKAGISFELTSLLLGVGYLIGLEVAAVMFAGGVMGDLVLVPLIDYVGHTATQTFGIGADAKTIAQMSHDDIRDTFVRYIGAGGVAMGGLMSLARSMPEIVSSFGASLRGYRGAAGEGGAADVPRNDRDLGMVFILGGSAASLALVFFTFDVGWQGILSGLVLSFFFVAVSSRMVGLIGSTSQPVSGMTITALLVTALLYSMTGWAKGPGATATILVSSVVCMAICLSGNIAQDLKTGTLVGGTPRWMQLGEVVTTFAFAAVAGVTLYLIHEGYGIGSKEAPAPQARLMAQLVGGVMGGEVQWALLGIGAIIALVCQCIRVSALSFAIGLYLPVSTSTGVIFGGLLAYFAERASRKRGEDGPSQRGTLLASGIVAGDALMGIVLAGVLVAAGGSNPMALRELPDGKNYVEDTITLVCYAALCVFFAWQVFGRKREHSPRG